MSFKGCVDCLEELDGSLEFREFGFFGQIAVVNDYVDLLKWSSIYWEVVTKSGLEEWYELSWCNIINGDFIGSFVWGEFPHVRPI
jgi:hypothetical protein